MESGGAGGVGVDTLGDDGVLVGDRALDVAVAAVDAGGASGPLALVDGVPCVRWSPGGALVPLRGYLDERIALALGS